MLRTFAALAILSALTMAFSAAPLRAAPLTLTQTLEDPTPTAQDTFGFSIAIDGDFVIVGAPDYDAGGVGHAYLFSASTGALLQSFLDPTPAPNEQFGASVAIQGNSVLIGAPAATPLANGVGQAHLFDTTTGALLRTFDDPTPTVKDNFGWSVAIDGNSILIGAHGHDEGGNIDQGQAFLFDADTGVLLHTFDDPTPTDHDNFGFSVSIDGNNVVIGAREDDTTGFARGKAHLFDASTGALNRTFDDPTPTGADQFGFSVAIDGNYILIGDRWDDVAGGNVGQAHLFDATTGALLRTFDDPTPSTADEFGFSVAIDGDLVLVGARYDDTSGKNAGQAYLFDVNTGALMQTFDNPTATPVKDEFGWSVAIDGHFAAVGASEVTAGGVGQAYIYSDLPPVPAPAALWLFATGLAAIGAVARRRVRVQN